MKLNNLNPQVVFACFTVALGSIYEKVCNDAKAQIGRWEKDVKSTAGDWKASNTGKLKSKEGHELSLPMNNPLSSLILFGMQTNELQARMGLFKQNGEGKVVAVHQMPIPSYCEEWVKQEHIKLADSSKEEEKEEVSAE